MENQIRKTLGVRSVVFALRRGDDLIRENGSPAFGPGEGEAIQRRFNTSPRPWFHPKAGGGAWLGIWPVPNGRNWTACFALGLPPKGGGLNREENHFMKWAVERAGLYLENISLWKRLEVVDRKSLAGFMSLAMAHEIRNPLTAMGTLVQLLPRKKNDSMFLEEFQKVMIREISHLTHLTEAYLNYSHPSQGKNKQVDLRDVVNQVVQFLKPHFELKKSRLTVRNPEGLFLSGDGHQIQSLVMNLLLNAFQAAGPGGLVQISSRLSRKSGKKWVELEIGDSGPGIPKQNLEKIFNPFFSTKDEGTGLGLAICRRIIQEHLGNLTIKTHPRKGTQFLVRMPFTQKS